jgi:hypothetical protein
MATKIFLPSPKAGNDDFSASHEPQTAAHLLKCKKSAFANHYLCLHLIITVTVIVIDDFRRTRPCVYRGYTEMVTCSMTEQQY